MKRLLISILLAAIAPSAGAAECPAPGPSSEPLPAIQVPANVHVGLALGSGGLHGFAHIGVLEEIEAAHLDVPIVAGTSVGALVGSAWASGVPAREIERVSIARHWDRFGSYSGAFVGDLAELQPLFGYRPIEQWPHRFAAVSTNLDNGHRRVFMSGDGVLAVRASTAIPVTGAIRVDGARFVDGALVEPLPVATARELGANFVIAVDIAYRPYEGHPSGFTGNSLQSVHILMNALAERDADSADFVLRLDLHEIMTRCGNRSLVAAGREAMRRNWPALNEALRARAAALARQ